MIAFVFVIGALACVSAQTLLNEIRYDPDTGAVKVEIRGGIPGTDYCIVSFDDVGVVTNAVALVSTGAPFEFVETAWNPSTAVEHVAVKSGFSSLPPGPPDCLALVGEDISADDNILNGVASNGNDEFFLDDVLGNVRNDVGVLKSFGANTQFPTAADMPAPTTNALLHFRVGLTSATPFAWYRVEEPLANDGSDFATSQGGMSRLLNTFVPAVTSNDGTFGQANGDPHLRGASGESYVLVGKLSNVYNLLSAPSFNVNFDLFHEETPANATRHYGLFMKTLGITVQGQYFELSRNAFPDVDALNNGPLASVAGASAREVSHVGLDLIEPASWRRFGIQRYLELTFCRGFSIVVAWLDNRVDVLQIEMPLCHDELDGAVGQTFQCKYVRHEAKWHWSRARELEFVVPSLRAPGRSYSGAIGCPAPSSVDKTATAAAATPLRSGPVRMGEAIGLDRDVRA